MTLKVKAKIENTKAIREIGSKIQIKTWERCHWRRSGIHFEQISHITVMFLLLTLNK